MHARSSCSDFTVSAPVVVTGGAGRTLPTPQVRRGRKERAAEACKEKVKKNLKKGELSVDSWREKLILDHLDNC